jgi:hypothetical protein
VAGVLTTHQQKENTMTATAIVGERVELGRYRISSGEEGVPFSVYAGLVG